MEACVIIKPEDYRKLKVHLFKGTTEQGAFLFVKEYEDGNCLQLIVDEVYLVPEDAWDHRSRAYLELSNEEKVKIMQAAKKKGSSLIECHSHRLASVGTHFSPSDEKGLEDFLGYVRWKLEGKTYGAIVFGDSAMEGKVWLGAVPPAITISRIRVTRRNAVLAAITGVLRVLRRLLGLDRQ